ARDLQQIKGDPAAVPTATREFTRTDRLLIRVPAYGGGDTALPLSVHLLNRTGQPMSELAVSPSSIAGGQQIELPLAGMAVGEYLVEIKAASDSGGPATTELVGFRIVG